QSGKIEDTKKHTVIAISNEHSYSIVIKRGTKRLLFRKLKSAKALKFKLFAICVYLTLKDFLDIDLELISIDEEYEGHEKDIQSELVNLIRKNHPSFDKKLIRFSRISKNSRAHILAYSVLKGLKEADKELSEKEIMLLI
ncbi:MAG: hypothetical protein AABY07_07225, partial [Nanoarchaeota archaeon]